MAYQPWFYLVTYAFWVGLGVLIGLRARRPKTVWGWSVGIAAFGVFAGIFEHLTGLSSFSLTEAIIGLIEITALIAGSAFAIRAVVARRRSASDG